MVDIDSETLFNWGAGVLATVAVLFFILNVDLGLSPATTTVVVLAFLAGVFAVTQRTDDPELRRVGYGVVLVSFVGLFFELFGTFRVGDTGIVLGLLVIAAVLFGLRTRLDDRERLASDRAATVAFGVLAVLAALVVVTDVATGGLAYELQPQSEIQVPEERYGEITVATVVASNPTPLPELVESPRYEACTGGDWSEYRFTEPDREDRPAEVNANVDDGYNEHVLSYSEREFPVVLRVHGENVTGETFPVQVTEECPDDESGAPYIALFEVDDDDRRYYGVAV